MDHQTLLDIATYQYEVEVKDIRVCYLTHTKSPDWKCRYCIGSPDNPIGDQFFRKYNDKAEYRSNKRPRSIHIPETPEYSELDLSRK